jgi:heat shock protein HslJ
VIARRMRTGVLAALSAGVVVVALSGCLAGCAAASGSGDGSGSTPGSSSSAVSTPSPTSSSPSPDTPSPSGSAPSNATPGLSLSGDWQLVSGTDSTGAITPGGAVVTLVFAGTQVHGNGSCNAFGATASAAITGPLTIRVGIHTEMACSQAARNATESRYFAALGRVTAAAIADNQLTLTGGGDTLVFSRLAV